MMYSECLNSNPKNTPIAGAFDFEAAFPSVIHAWICIVIEKCLCVSSDFFEVYIKMPEPFTHTKAKTTL